MKEDPFSRLTQQDRDFIFGQTSEFLFDTSDGIEFQSGDSLIVSAKTRAKEIKMQFGKSQEDWRKFLVQSDGVNTYALLSDEISALYLIRNQRINFDRESLESEIFSTIPSILSTRLEAHDPFYIMDNTQVRIYGVDIDEREDELDLSIPDSAQEYVSRLSAPITIRHIYYMVNAGPGLEFNLDIYNKIGLITSKPLAIYLPRYRLWEEGIVRWVLGNHRLNLPQVRIDEVSEELTHELNFISYKESQGTI